MRTYFVLCFVLVSACPIVDGFDDQPFEWRRSSFEAEGLDPVRWQSLIEKVESGFFREIRGLLVVKRGAVLAEHYFNGSHPDELIDIRSAGKSYTAALMGIAIDRGFVPGVDAKLLDYFPEYECSPDDPKWKITLQHTLMMSFGLAEPDGVGRDWDWPPTWDESWILDVLSLPMTFEPGERWEYHSAAPSLLGPVIRRASGMTIPEFAATYLFGPLDMTDFRWTFCPDGHAVTQGGFWTRPRDMAKIGQLHLQNGMWGGEQIISEAWVEESTRSHLIAAPMVGITYGYYWWREPFQIGDRWVEAFSASGNGGNKITVFPSEDLVVVVTATAYNQPWSGLQIRAMMHQYVLPAVMQYDGVPESGPDWLEVPMVGVIWCWVVLGAVTLGWPLSVVFAWKKREGVGRFLSPPDALLGGVAFCTAVVAVFILAVVWLESEFELLLNSGLPYVPNWPTIILSWLFSVLVILSVGAFVRAWVQPVEHVWSRWAVTAVAPTAVGMSLMMWRWEMLVYWF